MIPGIVMAQRTVIVAPPEAANYWISTISTADTDGAFVGRLAAVDSQNNIYTIFQSGESATIDAYLVKLTPEGTIAWQRKVSGASVDNFRAVATTSNAVYVAGQTNSQGAGSYDVILFKYDLDGVLQWQRRSGRTGIDYGFGLVTNGDDEIYVVGQVTNSTTDALIAKYNSAGTAQWFRHLSGNASDVFYSVSLDGAGNIYCAGYTLSTGTNGTFDVYLTKYNSAGNVQWQRLAGTAVTEIAYTVVADKNSTDVYVAGYTTNGAGGNDMLLLKYDGSTASLLTQKYIGGLENDTIIDLYLAPDGLYATGQTLSQGTGTGSATVLKFDTSLNLLWARTIGSSGSEFGRSILLDNTGALIVTASTSEGQGGSGIFVARLPADGSLTGTHGAYTYADATFTVANGALNSASVSFTSGTPTMTTASSTLTNTLGNASTSVVEVTPALWTPLNMATVPPIYLHAQDSAVTDVGGACSAISNLGSLGSDGDFSQATAGNRPLIITNELNGNTILRFDGANDVLTGGSTAQLNLFRNVTGAWGFVVYKKRTADVTALARAVLISANGTTGSSRFQIKVGDSVGPAPNRLGMSGRRADSDELARLSSPNELSGSYVLGLVRMQYNIRLGEVYENGILVASNPTLTTSGTVTSNTASTVALSLGASAAGGVPADIDLAAIVLGTGVLSVSDAEKLEGWAAHEYGLTANLPVDHPYKTTPPYA